MAGNDTILEMREVRKSFGNIAVLKSVGFTLRRGEVHALMGGNGAGKSTLMKILTGVYTMDAGTIAIDGKPVTINNPGDSERAGVAMIFQEFSLVPTLTVAQNIFLNREPRVGSLFIDDRQAYKRAHDVLKELGERIDPNTLVSELSAGMMQMVEIAKALSKNAKILIMDEPTASLSEAETETLFKVVLRLKASGISIIYISHRMAEIFELCDRVTVMRDGVVKLTHECASLTIPELVENMLGSSSAAAFAWQERHVRHRGEPVLKVSGLSLPPRVVDVSFEVYPGEIVGLAGLMGSGRTEIAEAVFGRRVPARGEISVLGKPISAQSDAIEAGVALVPEDRRRMGLVLDHSVQSNIMLPNLTLFAKGPFITDVSAVSVVRQMMARLRIKTESPSKIARLLSGGNQQKIVLSKWLARSPKLLILDEPTIGVDIGAKGEMTNQIRELADAGAAILVISSELEELLVVSDRLLILHHGRIVQDIQRRDVKSEEELHHAVQGHIIDDAQHAFQDHPRR
jgi:ribose transport system ATP-binding protein